jgi:hypothetical protein
VYSSRRHLSPGTNCLSHIINHLYRYCRYLNMWKELSITHLTTSADRELLTFRKTLLFETSTTQIEDHRFKSLSAYNSHDDYRDVFPSMAYLGLNAPSQDPNRHLHRQNTSHDIAQAAAQRGNLLGLQVHTRSHRVGSHSSRQRHSSCASESVPGSQVLEGCPDAVPASLSCAVQAPWQSLCPIRLISGASLPASPTLGLEGRENAYRSIADRCWHRSRRRHDSLGWRIGTP